MNKIKLKFLGFWEGFLPKDNLFYNILSKHFSVELTENPDFLICSTFCKPFEYAKYDCVRIFYTGENMSADFLSFDYSIDFDELDFGDRHIRYPLYLYNEKGEYETPPNLSLDEAKSWLKQKKYFCNLIYGHEALNGTRKEILESFSRFKKVECAGTYLNNMPDGKSVTVGLEKRNFLRQSKFTLAIESVVYPGFIGEKITDAFASYSVPIYFGNPNVGLEFNPKSFVNCHSYSNFDEVVKTVLDIDGNESRYLSFLVEPVFLDKEYSKKMYIKLEEFLVRIFMQPKEKAYRRMRGFQAEAYNNNLKSANEMMESATTRIAHAVIKKVKGG